MFAFNSVLFESAPSRPPTPEDNWYLMLHRRIDHLKCCIAWATLLSSLVLLSGCTSPTEGEGIAGTSYVEDDTGKLVPADGSHSQGAMKTPKRPAGSDKDWLTSFELTERSGRTVTSDELKGQPYVLSFFFTTCPTICKRQNAKVKIMQEKFKGRPIRFVSITCDPDVDSPELLSVYANQFGADPDQWLFLTGDMKYLRRVGSEMFYVAVDRRFHADLFLLIDADGNIYKTYSWPDETAWQNLLKDIQTMLDAGGKLPLK